MRIDPIVLPYLLGLLAASPQDALEKRKNWPVAFSSAHYEVRSTSAAADARKLADHMDLVFDTYAKLFAIRQIPNKKAVLVLFKDEAEYKANPGSPEGSGAYYDPNIKYLVGFFEPKRMYNVFAHEGTHQFTDLALKNMDRALPWFVEGMAECIGNSVVQKGKLFMCARNGIIAQEDLPVIQQQIKEKTYVPLKELVRMDQKTWDDRKGALYPEAWSFCSFLLAYPKYEETKSQIPNGKYWTVLSNYIKLLSDGKADPEAAFHYSLQLNGKPLDLDALEKEWSEYILKMENSGTLADKEFPVGTARFTVSPELAVALYYPAKEKGEKAPIDRSRGACPLLLFTPDDEEASAKLCQWLAESLASCGFMAAVLPGKGGTPEDAPRLLAARESLLKRNAEKDPAWKGAINPAQVVLVGWGPGAAAAVSSGGDPAKTAGVVLLGAPGPLKIPEKYKVATLIVSAEEGQEASLKIYADLKKPRYLYVVSGLEKSFTPPEKAEKVFGLLWSWLSYRCFDRDDLKSLVSGAEAQEQLKKGELKLLKVEE